MCCWNKTKSCPRAEPENCALEKYLDLAGETHRLYCQRQVESSLVDPCIVYVEKQWCSQRGASPLPEACPPLELMNTV